MSGEPGTAGVAVAVDVAAIERGGTSGAVWSLPHGGDLDANAVVLQPGDAVGAHVNDEVDVVVIGVSGHGAVEIDGNDHRLAAGWLVFVPKGATRSIAAARDEGVVYVTVHRARSGLRIAAKR